MTSFMEFMFCINRHIRKFILFQCQDGARGGDRPPCSYATDPVDPVASATSGCEQQWSP